MIAAEQLILEESAPGQIVLRGTPGAVEPPGATVRITNLESTADAVEAVVADDGSFSVPFGGTLADVLRVQARDVDERNVPLDVTGQASGQPVVVLGPDLPCLVSTPEIEADEVSYILGQPMTRITITFRNDCAAAVTVVDVRMRQSQLDTFVIPAPGQFLGPLAPGEERSFEVGFKSLDAGSFEDVALVDLEMAGGPRRGITVRGTAVDL